MVVENSEASTSGSKSTTPQSAENAESTQIVTTTIAVLSASHTPTILHTGDIVVVTITAILSVVIVCMIAVIVGLYVQKRKRRRRIRITNQNMAEALADLEENSIDNPVYGGWFNYYFIHN